MSHRVEGHREKLLAGARRCLYEKGYARITARDIVAASGANLASIGYHFGSKEALLSAAIIDGLTEWADEISQVVPASQVVQGDRTMSSMERLEFTWNGIIKSFSTHRPLWVASVEASAQAEHLPEVRERLAASYRDARVGLARVLVEAAGDERTADAIGSFQLALMGGLTLQWLIDPDNAPSGADLAHALRVITTLTTEAGHPSA